MSGRKIKRQKLTTLTDTHDRSVADVEEGDGKGSQNDIDRPWSDLPPELLELIASSGLTPYDRTEASRVCKTWHSVFRVKTRFPWIFYYPRWDRDPKTFKLFSPTMLKTYSIDIPEELRGAIPCYAKDGWLLFCRHLTSGGGGGVFFFNPFTRESIKLPDFERRRAWLFAFSCAPTSPGCVVLIATPNFDDLKSIRIHTCHPGATEWTTSIHRANNNFFFSPEPGCEPRFVVCNGLFYYLSFSAFHVAIFDPQGRTWTVPEVSRSWMWHGKFTATTFAAVYRGEILRVHIFKDRSPRIFMLHDRGGYVEWGQEFYPDGVTFFPGYLASHATSRTDLPPGRERIYLPGTRLAGKKKRCLSYSIDDGRYHPRETWNRFWVKPHRLNNLWIEPPQELPSFFSCKTGWPEKKEWKEWWG